MTQDWTLEEALAYYRRQGAPGEQGASAVLILMARISVTFLEIFLEISLAAAEAEVPEITAP